MCPRSPALRFTDRQVAPLLTEQARRFRDAVAGRRAGLLAADRFYRDIMVYQWRLDALASQLRAVDAAGGAAVPINGDEEAQRRRVAFEGCLAELASQRTAAVAALAERAASYALCAPAAAAGRVGRLAATEEERNEAMEGLERLAGDTYDEITNEAREILRVAPGMAALERLRSALGNRQDFWQGQLEDTWAAWQEATERMHRAGDEALRAWAEVAAAADAVESCWQVEPQGLQATVLQALAAAAARLLEVELLEPLGLSGLHGRAGASAEEQGEQAAAEARDFGQDARLALLACLIEVLRSLGALHRLGEALLSGASAAGVTTLGSSAGASPLLPDITQAALAASRPSAEDRGADISSASAAWLVEGVVEALCDAAALGDFPRAHGLLEMSHGLGGRTLAEHVRAAPSRSRARRGAAAAQLAAAGGHERLVRLLKSWPELSDLDAGPARRCLDLLPPQEAKLPEEVQHFRHMRVRAALMSACERLGVVPSGPVLQ